MLKINNQSFSYLILFLTIIKIIFSIYFGDELIDMEWKIIYQNLINYGEFSYNEINGVRVPTVYMPPLYPYFLYSFSFFGLNELITTKLILFVQCVLSSISIFVFFKLLKNFLRTKLLYYINTLFYLSS